MGGLAGYVDTKQWGYCNCEGVVTVPVEVVDLDNSDAESRRSYDKGHVIIMFLSVVRAYNPTIRATNINARRVCMFGLACMQPPCIE